MAKKVAASDKKKETKPEVTGTSKKVTTKGSAKPTSQVKPVVATQEVAVKAKKEVSTPATKKAVVKTKKSAPLAHSVGRRKSAVAATRRAPISACATRASTRPCTRSSGHIWKNVSHPLAASAGLEADGVIWASPARRQMGPCTAQVHEFIGPTTPSTRASAANVRATIPARASSDPSSSTRRTDRGRFSSSRASWMAC